MLDLDDVRWELGRFGKLNVRHGKGSRRRGPKPRPVPLINGADRNLRWFIEDVCGQPNTVKLDELDVIRAVLGCDVGELLLPEPVALPQPAASQSPGAVAEARAVTPRSRTGRSLPPR